MRRCGEGYEADSYSVSDERHAAMKYVYSVFQVAPYLEGKFCKFSCHLQCEVVFSAPFQFSPYAPALGMFW
jgi:hypothetical protein